MEGGKWELFPAPRSLKAYFMKLTNDIKLSVVPSSLKITVTQRFTEDTQRFTERKEKNL